MAKVQSEYDKAVKKDLIKKNTASRRKAALHAFAKKAGVKLTATKAPKATAKAAPKATKTTKPATKAKTTAKKPAVKKSAVKKPATTKK